VARPTFTYLSEADKDFIHEQTVRILGEVGVAYNTPTLTAVLQEAGAEVDAEKLTAKLPWMLVERCLETVPPTVLLAGRDRVYDCVVGGEQGILYTSDGAATYMLDDLTGERHEGTRADLAQMTRLYDAVPEIDFVWATITPGDGDPRAGNLEMARITYDNCRKHLQDEVRRPDQAPVFVEMLEAIAGASLKERPIWSATNCTIAPLQHDAEMTEAHILMAQAGCPVFVLPMPQMGTTGPMSVLGTSILNMAELLSAVVLFQLAAPGCGMVSAVGSAVAEMRNGLYLSGAPEDALINVMCIEMSKRYGLLTQGSAVSCDAKACNHQAGVEGTLTGMATALAGADVMLAFGLLDSAQTASLAKTVLDADTVNAIERFMREEPIDEARALVDDIVEVGIGGHYLVRRSTRRFARAGELWQPDLWQRGPFDQYVGTPLVKEAWERAHDLIERSDVPPLPDDVRRHCDELIAGYLSRRA
jgi:trimethylamine--corrinoid protein Co-methyltransferase